jgi:hypothetical protein
MQDVPPCRTSKGGVAMNEPAYTARISLLKCFARSAAHARAFIDGALNDETLSMRLGSGGHALLFGRPSVVVFPGVRRGKAWDAFEQEHKGSVILNEREHSIALAMARAIQVHPDADRLMFAPQTQHEVPVEWLYGGRRCSGRLDSLGPRALVDLKCVVDASPQRLPWQARKMGWAAQLAWYSDGVELAGMDQRPSYLIAVESSPPYNVVVYQMTDEDIDFGRRQYEAWFAKLLECEAADAWPGYADGILPLNVLGLPMTEDEPSEEEEAA